MDYKGRVLLVEDNAELNANNARALRILDYEVHTALTLADARVWLDSHEPDVILLDVMLPDGDGIDFCVEIRGAPLRTAAHILFLTARTGYEDRVRGLAGGGDDYIIKPFHPEELLARVEAAMRRISMSPPDNRMLPNGLQSFEDAEAEKHRAFAAHYSLTKKENETLSCILRNLSIKEMAGSMGISRKGVEYHITNILCKSGIERRHELLQVYADWEI